MESSYLSIMNEICILFVDHELPLPAMNTVDLLKTCGYQVNHAELATHAMQILASGKWKFDFIIANINSPDMRVFKLLQVAVTMDIPMIIMSPAVEDDTTMAMALNVINSGAFLYIKRPTTLDILRCLWQHVARENIRAMRERERLLAANYVDVELTTHLSGQNPNFFFMKEKGKLKKSYLKGRGVEEEYESDNPSHGKVKRKVCTEWTQDLHEKFMAAVAQLSEGDCFPKEILALMNVPGLTRMQVASHLQKCRNDNWRSPEERKATLGMQPSSSGGPNRKVRRFGIKPRLIKEDNSDSYASRGSETYTVSGSGGVQETGFNTMMGNQTGYPQHYGAMVPHQNNVVNSSSIITNQSGDDFLNLQDMGCLIQSGLPQGFVGVNHPQPGSRGFDFEAGYGQDRVFGDGRKMHSYGKQDEEKSKMASFKSRSQWATSSETSNFAIDD